MTAGIAFGILGWVLFIVCAAVLWKHTMKYAAKCNALAAYSLRLTLSNEFHIVRRHRCIEALSDARRIVDHLDGKDYVMKLTYIMSQAVMHEAEMLYGPEGDHMDVKFMWQTFQKDNA